MPPPVREAEGPLFHIGAVVVPLVSPGKNQGAGAAGRECGPHLPRENARLAVLAVSKAVQPNLGQNHRPIACNVLEASEVGLKTLLLLKVDVKGNKVDERQLQIFSGRIVHISNEALGILGFRGAVELLENTLDATPAVPAHDGSRDLVADHVGEYSRVTDTRRHPGAYALLYRLDAFPIVEEGEA